jgi:hypothetical protein
MDRLHYPRHIFAELINSVGLMKGVSTLFLNRIWCAGMVKQRIKAHDVNRQEAESLKRGDAAPNI